MSGKSSEQNDRLEELLADWEIARLEGNELTPEELAKDHPDLRDEVRQALVVLKSMSWVTDEPEHAVSLCTIGSESKSLPDSTLSASELIAAIEASGLIPPTELAKHTEHQTVSDSPGTARELAEQLVAREVITSYQAQTLLSERDTPLLLDRYIILDVIGAGGMGLVFKALHRSMERVVALKILPKEAVDSPAKVERFRREIKAVAKLSHPNIASAHDAHEAEGTHFLVMEYVQGKNLFDFVADHGPLSPRQATPIIARIADALGEAHSQGIIHRDVKPSNVLLSDEGIPKLLDLGIARVHQATGEPEALTTEGIPVGTVAYIAPEQIQGGQHIDGRADVYSLGCTLFFLLTGKPLFDKKSGVQTVAAHLIEEPPSLSVSSATIPASLERVYERMVAKDPKDRFDSMTQVVAALEATGLADASGDAGPRDVASATGRSSGSVAPWKLAIAAITALLLVSLLPWMRPQIAPATEQPTADFPSDSDTMVTPVAQSDRADPRDVARWILARGGRLVVQNTVGEWECEEFADLPDGAFDLVAAELEGSSGDIELKVFRSQPKLSRLALWGISLDADDLSVIKSLKSVVDLEVSDCGLTDQSLLDIATMTWLQALDLSENVLSDDGIARLSVLKRLNFISLRETNLTELGLRSLQTFPVLAELDIGETEVGRGGLAELARFGSLQRLNIAGLDLSATDVGVLGKLPDLSELSVGHMELTDEIVEAIAQLSSLQMVEFMDADLTDRHLLILAKLPQLELIEANEAELTESGIERFEQLRPDVEVVRDEHDEED